MPPLRAVLGATDALLKGGRRKWAGPSLRHEGAEEVFRDFWEATDLARLLISDEKKWQARFAGTLEGVLTINERMALPGKKMKLIWVTGDATLDKIGTVDWTHR